MLGLQERLMELTRQKQGPVPNLTDYLQVQQNQIDVRREYVDSAARLLDRGSEDGASHWHPDSGTGAVRGGGHADDARGRDHGTDCPGDATGRDPAGFALRKPVCQPAGTVLSALAGVRKPFHAQGAQRTWRDGA